MERDYFAEEIEGQDTTDYYSEEIEKKIPKPENVLSRALRAGSAAISAGVKNATPSGFKVNSSFPFLPQIPTDSPALSAGLSEANMPITKGNHFADAGIQILGGMLAGGKMTAPAVAKGVGNVAGKTGNLAGRVFSSGKNLKRTEDMLAKTEGQLGSLPRVSDIESGARKGQRIVGDVGKRMLGEAKDVGQKKVSQTALRESKVTKRLLKKKIGKNTDIYGSGLADAEDALSGNEITRGEYFDEVIRPALDEGESKFLTNSPAYQKLKSYASDFADNQNPLTVEQIKEFKNSVVKNLSDHVENTFFKSHAGFIGKRSKEMAQLNQEFAPMRQATGRLSKIFRPFQKQETQKGADLIKRIANGKASETDLNYLKTLKEGSGRFSGAGDIGRRTKSVVKELEDTIARISKEVEVEQAMIRRAASEQSGNVLSRSSTLAKRRAILQAKEKQLSRLNKARIGLIATGVGLGAGKMLGGFGRFVGYHSTRELENASVSN